MRHEPHHALVDVPCQPRAYWSPAQGEATVRTVREGAPVTLPQDVAKLKAGQAMVTTVGDRYDSPSGCGQAESRTGNGQSSQ